MFCNTTCQQHAPFIAVLTTPYAVGTTLFLAGQCCSERVSKVGVTILKYGIYSAPFLVAMYGTIVEKRPLESLCIVTSLFIWNQVLRRN